MRMDRKKDNRQGVLLSNTVSDLEQLLKEVKEKKIYEADASWKDSFNDSLAHLSLLNVNIWGHIIVKISGQYMNNVWTRSV